MLWLQAAMHGEAHPEVHRPFVLYGGTPFAILILPVQ